MTSIMMGAAVGKANNVVALLGYGEILSCVRRKVNTFPRDSFYGLV